jgi:hypothetical protein
VFIVDQGERKLIRRTLLDEQGSVIPWDRVVDIRFSLMLGAREYKTYSKENGDVTYSNDKAEFELTQEQSSTFPPTSYQLRVAIDVYDDRFTELMTDKQWETPFMSIRTVTEIEVYDSSVDDGEIKFSVIPAVIPTPTPDPLEGEPVIGSISTTSSQVTIPYTLVPNATLYEYQIEGSADIINIGMTNPLVLSKGANVTERIRIRAGRDVERTNWSDYKEYTTNPDTAPVLGTISTDLTTATIPFTETGLDIEYDIGGGYVNAGSTSPIEITNLNEQTSYNGTVRFSNAGGGGPTTTISFETIEPVPTGIPVISTNTLTEDGGTFNRTSVAGGNEYEIEVGGVVSSVGTNNPYSITGQAQNDTFQHRIRAKNSGGVSDWSDFYEVLTLPDTAPTFTPDEVTDTTATFSYGTVGGTGTLSYQRRVGLNGDWVTVTGGTFQVTGLTPESDTDIYMRVTNASGSGPVSAPVTVTTTPTTAYLEWGAVTGATGYRYKLGETGTTTDLGLVTNVTLTDLQPGEYDFSIRSLDNSGVEDIRSVWTMQRIVLPEIEEDPATTEQFVITAS